jgi:hypothetical protein
MCLTYAVLGKIVRESLVTTTPLVLDADGVANLKTKLEAWFARTEDLSLWWRDQSQRSSNWRGLARHLCGVAPKDKRHSGYGVFSLGLDRKRKLRLGYKAYEPAHPVGNLDELFILLGHCQERAARRKGQHARRAKVQKLRNTAVLSRVLLLARAFQFDYRTEEGRDQLKMSLRFEGKHIVEVAIPLDEPDEALRQLEATLPNLRKLLRATIHFTVQLNASRGALYGQWVSYQSLGQE